MSDKVTILNPAEFPEELRYQYDLKTTDTVLDIGSYRREFADKIIKIYGCHVECFDALDNRAAWLYDGKIAMGGNYLYTSMHAEVIDREYWCIDIAKYLHSEVALCKINIEGGEYQLIEYVISKGLIGNIKNLQVQFHLIDGVDCEKAYDTLKQLLSLTHRQTWCYPFCWENWTLIDVPTR